MPDTPSTKTPRNRIVWWLTAIGIWFALLHLGTEIVALRAGPARLDWPHGRLFHFFFMTGKDFYVSAGMYYLLMGSLRVTGGSFLLAVAVGFWPKK